MQILCFLFCEFFDDYNAIMYGKTDGNGDHKIKNDGENKRQNKHQ